MTAKELSDIGRQLGSLDRKQQQISAPISDAQLSRLYDAMEQRAKQYKYHWHGYRCHSDTHISGWSKTPPSPEVRLDEKFPCLAQARRKRVRMKKLIITAILSILGTGFLAMYGPRILTYIENRPRYYAVRMCCPNCQHDGLVSIPKGQPVLGPGRSAECRNCEMPFDLSDLNTWRTYNYNGDLYITSKKLSGTINGVQLFK